MSAYREGFGPLEQKRAEVALVRARVAASAEGLAKVAGARLGRVAGAMTGFAGLLALAFSFGFYGEAVQNGFVALAYFGAALAALAAQLVVGAMAKAVLGARARAMRAAEAEGAKELLAASHLEAVEALDPWPSIAARLRKLEWMALVSPLALASFFLPLSVHAAVYAPFAALGSVASPLQDFSVWIIVSAVIVGHAHLALAICAGRFGAKLAHSATSEIDDVATRKAWTRAFCISVAVASAPGIVLLAVPTVLALATGIAVVPVMFRVAHHLALRERDVTDAVEGDVARLRGGVDVEQMERVRQDLVATAERVRVAATEEVRARVADEPAREEWGEREPSALTSSRRSRRESA